MSLELITMKREIEKQLKEKYEQDMRDWKDSHIKRVLKELKQAGIELTQENIPKIIQETNFSVRSKKHPNACPCYHPEATSCHPNIEDLNCFLCACPNYNETLPGYCRINSDKGFYYQNSQISGGKVLDCSECTIPHQQDYVKKYLQENLDYLRKLSENL